MTPIPTTGSDTLSAPVAVSRDTCGGRHPRRGLSARGGRESSLSPNPRSPPPQAELALVRKCPNPRWRSRWGSGQVMRWGLISIPAGILPVGPPPPVLPPKNFHAIVICQPSTHSLPPPSPPIPHLLPSPNRCLRPCAPTILARHGLAALFPVVCTNPSRWEAGGVLRVGPHAQRPPQACLNHNGIVLRDVNTCKHECRVSGIGCRVSHKCDWSPSDLFSTIGFMFFLELVPMSLISASPVPPPPPSLRFPYHTPYLIPPQVLLLFAPFFWFSISNLQWAIQWVSRHDNAPL